MVNLLNGKKSKRDLRPQKWLFVRTLFLLSIFLIVGAILGAIIGAAINFEQRALFLAIFIGAVAGGVSQHKSKMGSKFNWYIWVLFNWNHARYKDYRPIHTSGRVFLGTIAGALVSGIIAASFILYLNNSFFDFSWFPKWGYEYPNRLFSGALLGASIFIFRKILLKYRTWSTWTMDDFYLYKTVTTVKTKKEKMLTTPIDLTGVLQECPICRKKQNVKTTQCSCGEDLIRAQKSGRTKYWIHYYLPGGAERKEFVGNSIEMAARHAAVKIKVYNRVEKQTAHDE